MMALIRRFFLVLALLFMIFSANSVLAQTALPFNPRLYPGVDQEIISRQSGSQGVVNTIRNVYEASLGILGPFLVILIAWFGIRLVIAGGNEEKFTAVSQHFLYLLIGAAFVIFAKFLSETFFLYNASPGGTAVSFVSSEGQIVGAASAFQLQVEILIKFIRYVLSGLAVFFVVKSGSVILFSGDDELVSKQKDVFIYGFVGFLLIMISSGLIDAVFNLNVAPDLNFGDVFVTQSVDVGGGIALLGNITSLALAVMGVLFLFMLVAGGVLYAFSAGNQEAGQKGTKIITGALIGLVISFSSYTIVAEFSSGGRGIREANPAITPLDPSLPSGNPSDLP